MFHYMNEKEVTFNVKYEIVLYTPVFNARCWAPGSLGLQRCGPGDFMRELSGFLIFAKYRD